MRRTDQMWLIGGLLAIVLVVTGSWFLLISPKFTQADDVQAEADGTSLQLIKLNKEVAALIAQEKNKATYVAKLEASQTALPTGYNNMPAYVRALQDSGSATNVDVTGITTGTPIASVTVPKAVELPITLVADGTTGSLSAFLVRLQSIQPRAVLIKSITFTEKEQATGNGGTKSTGSTTANLTLSAFCLKNEPPKAGENCTVPV